MDKVQGEQNPGSLLETLMLPVGVSDALLDMIEKRGQEANAYQEGERADMEAAAAVLKELEALVNAEAGPMARASSYAGLRSVITEILRTKGTLAGICGQLIGITEDDA